MPFDLLRRKESGADTRITVTPPADIYQQDDQIRLALEMPGVDRKTLRVDQQGRELTVRGVREDGAEAPRGYRGLYQERYPVEYLRAFELNEEVDLDTVQASYSAGVLTVTLTRKPSACPRRIEIQSAA